VFVSGACAKVSLIACGCQDLVNYPELKLEFWQHVKFWGLIHFNNFQLNIETINFSIENVYAIILKLQE